MGDLINIIKEGNGKLIYPDGSIYEVIFFYYREELKKV